MTDTTYTTISITWEDQKDYLTSSYIVSVNGESVGETIEKRYKLTGLFEGETYDIGVIAKNKLGNSPILSKTLKTSSMMELNKYKINDGYINGTVSILVAKLKLIINNVESKVIPTSGDGLLKYYANDKILNPTDEAYMVGMNSASVETVRRRVILNNWTEADLTVNPMTTLNAYLSGTAPIGSTVRYSVDGSTKTIGTAVDGTYKWAGGVQLAGTVMCVELREGTMYIVKKEIVVQALAGSPNAPTNLKVEGLTDISAKLKWDAVAGATGYRIYQNGYNTVWKTTTTNSYDLTGTSGATWTYRVAAYNATGEGLRAQEVIVTYL